MEYIYPKKLKHMDSLSLFLLKQKKLFCTGCPKF